MSDFVHLHLHTEFSMLDGAARINDVMAAAAAPPPGFWALGGGARTTAVGPPPAAGGRRPGGPPARENWSGALVFPAGEKRGGPRPITGRGASSPPAPRHDRPRRADHEIFH